MQKLNIYIGYYYVIITLDRKNNRHNNARGNNSYYVQKSFIRTQVVECDKIICDIVIYCTIRSSRKFPLEMNE